MGYAGRVRSNSAIGAVPNGLASCPRVVCHIRGRAWIHKQSFDQSPGPHIRLVTIYLRLVALKRCQDCCWLFIVERERLGGQRTILSLALAPSRGEFDFDLGAEGAGDLFERRQRHPIVISPVQARDVGLLHADPPRELRLGPAFLKSGSDQTLRELKLRAEFFILFPYLKVLKARFGAWLVLLHFRLTSASDRQRNSDSRTLR